MSDTPTPLERARRIAGNPAISGDASAGQSIVTLIQLDGRPIDELSREELLLLAKGANWCSDHELSFRVMSIAANRETVDDEVLEFLSLTMQNACAGDRNRFLRECERCIQRGIGPSSFWHLRKGWVLFDHATGDDEEEPQWEPTDPVRYPDRMKFAAEEFRKASASDATVWEFLDERERQCISIALRLGEESPANGDGRLGG